MSETLPSPARSNRASASAAATSKRRVMPGGRASPATLPRGPLGRVLCRWCITEVPKGRRTFCSDACVHAWRLRTSPGYLRQQVLLRDGGICARCTVDTVAALRMIRRSRGERRQHLLSLWGLRVLKRKSLWDADHIVPVVEGGGECDLDNLRTLCLHCHRVVTRALAARRQVARSQSVPSQSASFKVADGDACALVT